MSLAARLVDALPALPGADLDWKSTLEINAVGAATIPVLAFIGPQVLTNTAEACRVRIRLNFRTRNHMGSLYFAVLCAGADVASGLPVVRLMRETGKYLVPSFKDLHADFLKRAEGDVVFENESLAAIEDAYRRAVASGERVNLPVSIVARVGEDVVARFRTTLSMKHKAGAPLPWYQELIRRLG